MERYRRFAKALITRPGGGSTALTSLGHTLEIVPLTDPTSLSRGDTLRAEVRFRAVPIRGVTVHAGYAGQPGTTHAQSHSSDAVGQVAVPLTTPGLWYLRTVHMLEVADAPFQWESFWATTTFSVQ